MLSLLLRAPSVALAARRYLQNYYNPMLEAYHKGDLDTALNYFLDGLMSRKGALEQLPHDIKRMMSENSATIGEVEAKLPIFGKAEAGRIAAPTLLINGSDGTMIFRAINKQLAKSIPNSQIALIPSSSHFPHFENSSSFNKNVLDFLRGPE